MIKYFIRVFFLSAGLLSSLACFASTPNTNFSKYHWYAGGLLGFGTTTWASLVADPSFDEEYNGLVQSVPIDVVEGGAIYGGFAGYEFNPYFAIEAAYMHYPNSIIRFEPVYSFFVDDYRVSEFTSQTETVNLLAKVMVFIPGTNGVRFYSGIGGAGVHRKDIVIDAWKLTPTFALGFNYNFTDHIMAELAGTFTAGYGEPRLDAARGYFPFLYSGLAKLAYRF